MEATKYENLCGVSSPLPPTCPTHTPKLDWMQPLWTLSGDSVEFIRDYLDWLDLLPGGNKGVLGKEVRGQVAQIFNGFTVGEHVVINMRGHH